MAISPNPGSGKFTVNAKLADKGNVEIRVLDLSGREVMSKILGDSDDINEQIDITEEVNGVYFLVIQQGEQQFNAKLMKQN